MNMTPVVVVTTDAVLVDSLESASAESVAFTIVPDLQKAFSTLMQTEAGIAVFDVRHVIDGGHAADRTLAQIRETFPGVALILCADEQCPEILERRATTDGMMLFRNTDGPTELFSLIESQIAARNKDSHTDESQPVCGVLEGVSRSFETHSPAVKGMLDDLAIAASHDVTILLIGETGSGKTYLSKLIHEASPRRDEPFLHVACGALPRDLIESELFGHVKGAFTSAHADKEGKFVAARRGTVLLDEIDVLGPEQQVKLLKVIETGEFEPVGSNRTLKSQARLVVASNLDLQPLVEQGQFRPDLYYRLNMLKFEVPPLRQRKIDVIPLARKFIDRFCEKHGVVIERVDDELLRALVDYPWPGNVRELEHVVQRAVIYCRNKALSAEHLPSHILAGRIGPVNDPSVQIGRTIQRDPSLGRQVATTEKEIIEQTLSRNNFSRTVTARELGISRVTLYNKMKKYNMMQ